MDLIMAWIIRLPDDGPQISSDDFTLDQLDRIEKSTGTYWSICNPLREISVARAFLKAAYEMGGRDPGDVDGLTMRTLKSMFDYIEDTPAGDPQERPTKARKGPKRRSSSTGARTGSSGPPVLPGGSGSVTSSTS